MSHIIGIRPRLRKFLKVPEAAETVKETKGSYSTASACLPGVSVAGGGAAPAGPDNRRAAQLRTRRSTPSAPRYDLDDAASAVPFP